MCLPSIPFVVQPANNLFILLSKTRYGLIRALVLVEWTIETVGPYAVKIKAEGSGS